MIPIKMLDEGIQLCKENVDRLLYDAYILDKEGSHGHALALAILAMEEYAKKLILVASAISPGESDEPLEKAFKSHDYKLEWACDRLIRALPDASQGKPLQEKVEELKKLLSTLKLSCLYVDHDDEMGWIDPNRPNVEGGAQTQVRYTEELIKATEPWVSEAYWVWRGRITE
jgi:AbiV family abortive infection protein